MQRSYRNKYLASVIRLVMSFLFLGFIFPYLYWMQSDMLTAVQHILSGGATAYSPAVGALLIACLLLLVEELLYRLFMPPMRYLAFAYAPSCALLAFITSADPVSGQHLLWTSATSWSIAFFIGALAVLALCYKIPEYNADRPSRMSLFAGNTLILTLLLYASAALGNTNEIRHHQVAMEGGLRQEDYSAMLSIGVRSDSASHATSAMRGLALSVTGQLPERLFEYPQLYGSRGLMIYPGEFLSGDTLADRFYRHWQAIPGKRIQSDPVFFFKILAEKEREQKQDTVVSRKACDYYLCALLLDRRIDDFAREIAHRYPLNDSLPQYYKEALILYKHIRMHPVVVYNNSSVEENFRDFQNLSQKITDPVIMRNLCRLAFGKTYWHYYLNEKKE